MESNYTLRAITLEEKELQAVVQFTIRNFKQDEPMNAASQKKYSGTGIGEGLMATAQEGFSVVALDDRGEIVGVSLNGLIKREEADTHTLQSTSNSDENGIGQLLLHLRREDKMWEKLPKTCNTVLELQHCAVHSNWRRKGIMTALCRETERVARTIGAGALRMEATSTFSAKAAEKLGFRMIYRLPYKDQIYTPQPAAPHLEARVYIKEL